MVLLATLSVFYRGEAEVLRGVGMAAVETVTVAKAVVELSVKVDEKREE